MSYFEAVILGLVQGLAEFLPISSSGHLALLQQAFGVSEDKVLLFAVLLHVGTLISVFIVYWKDIWALIVELCLTIKDLCTGKGLRLAERPVRKLGVMIIVATIPTAVIGLAFSDFFDSLYTSVIPIGVGSDHYRLPAGACRKNGRGEPRHSADELSQRDFYRSGAGRCDLSGDFPVRLDPVRELDLQSRP